MARIKGSQKTGGRTKGSQNALTKTFKTLLTETLTKLQEDKKHNLEAWAKENPTEFYKIASKLIPAEISATVETKTITVITPKDDNE